jgi:hypothetical protein
MLNRATAVLPLAMALLLGGLTRSASADLPVPAVVVRSPAPKLSKFDAVAARTGTLIRREEFVLQSAKAQDVEASIVRIEDITAHEVVLGLQVVLTEKHGIAMISEEEMPDLKDSVDYIVQNVTKLNESASPVRLEYRALSGATFGYSVHRLNAEDTELPPTAYIEVPLNPYYPQIGGMQRLSAQFLQKIVADAQKSMESLRAEKAAK